MQILGIKIDNINTEDAIQKIGDWLNKEEQNYIATPNPEIILAAQKDEEFKKILNSASLSVPDGIGLVLWSRMLGKPLKERVSGVDIMLEICKKYGRENKIFLIGAKEGIAKIAAQNIKKSINNINIVGTESDEKNVIDKINNFVANIVFVALGAPKQEKWIYNNKEKMPNVKVFMGVGGAFDMIAGTKPRAPRILRYLGLEWLWRLIIEPKRIKRIWNATVVFSYFMLKEKINHLFFQRR